ncbi:MAG: hypothetical protein ACYC6W_09665 [Nitrosotalea sp.]
MSNDDISLFLGITSIVVAVGLTVYTIWLDRHRRKNEEKFYATEIKENLRTITQYFLTISSISSDHRGYDENEATISLNDYYTRHHQEMTDLLYLTKLYLTQWRTINDEKKKIIKDILERFSWLSYEYYPLHLPDSIKKTRWQNEWEELGEKKKFVTTNVPIILTETP